MAQQEPTAPFVGTEQNVVFALQEKWDTGTLAWIKDTGTAGGGGAVTIADGADVTQGAVGDAAWVAGDGTVIALLKAIAGASGVPGLTDAELRATPVPVSGTVAVTGPLTDVQLRAVAVPISGTVSTKTDLNPSSPTATSVGVASAEAVAANASRKGLILINTSNARISLGFGAAAVLDSGITLYPGGVFCMDEFSFDVGAVNAIASAAASNLAIQEYA